MHAFVYFFFFHFLTSGLIYPDLHRFTVQLKELFHWKNWGGNCMRSIVKVCLFVSVQRKHRLEMALGFTDSLRHDWMS